MSYNKLITMKQLILIGFFILYLNSLSLKSQINNLSEAINKSGQQRMLSQRIAKDFLFIGIATDSFHINKASKELNISSKLFEKNQMELKQFISNNSYNNIQKQIAIVDSIWTLYKKVFFSTTNIVNAKEILYLSQSVLNECNNTVLLFEKKENKKRNSIINLSGKQRMLSQKIALYYIADSWNFENNDFIKKQYKNSKDEFWRSLRTISSYKDNTDIIKNKIKVVKVLFRYETKGFKLNKVFINDVFQITNELQNKMNIITKMYEDLETK